MGKTSTMAQDKAGINDIVTKAGGATLWINLAIYQTDLLLFRAVFENHAFQSWLSSQHQLHLFLDSLDECLLNINTVDRLLLEELEKHPLDRLYLRLSCRTADLPGSLELGLTKLWPGEGEIGVYELAPLRKADVIAAAIGNGIDKDKFLTAIHDKAAVPFAIKPITLQFLLNIYKKDSELPWTKSELYLRGCKILCDEPANNRQNKYPPGRLSTGQRLLTAARIAAIAVCGNRYSYWTGNDLGNVPEEDLLVEDLCGHWEMADNVSFRVTEGTIRETLGTGLFSSRGLGRIGWAHQSYAEFLSAWYLHKKSLAPAQIASLILHPHNSPKGIIPQLRHTSAWLAGFIPEVFRLVIESDPDLLIESDLGIIGAGDKEALVAALLKLSKAIRWSLDNEEDRRYNKLWHPGLAKQLEPFITGREKETAARLLAFAIARQCHLSDTYDIALGVALNPKEGLDIREAAAFTACTIGDDQSKAGLRPLALSQAGSDPFNELKGYGLRAVWPLHMTAEELFASLVPHNHWFSGPYEIFLLNELPKHLTPTNILHALNWLASLEVEEDEQETPLSMPITPDPLEEVILKIAWGNLRVSAIFEGFIRLIISRLRQNNRVLRPLKKQIAKEHNKRRKIVKALIPALDHRHETYWWLIDSRLLTKRDLYWAIEMCLASSDENEQEIYASMLWHIFLELNHDMDAIYIALQSNSILAEIFEPFFGPIAIDSPEATKEREEFVRTAAIQNKVVVSNVVKRIDPERVETLLKRLDDGDLDAWWQLNIQMALDIGLIGEQQLDLTRLPYWRAADEQTKAKILKGAEKYIAQEGPTAIQWVGSDYPPRPVVAGYRALLLLVQKGPEFFTSSRSDIWAKWVPVILGFPPVGQEIDRLREALVRVACRDAKQEILDFFRILVDQDESAPNAVLAHIHVLLCIDDSIADVLIKALSNDALSIRSTANILDGLVCHGCAQAVQLAESLVSQYPFIDKMAREKGVAAACVLAKYSGDAAWPLVWAVMQQDHEFGHRVAFQIVGQASRPDAIAGKLNEKNLADLVLWLLEQSPGQSSLALTDGTGSTIGLHPVLWGLRNRGTFQSYWALERIAARLPWSRSLAVDALNIARRNTWVPPKPAIIIEMAGNENRRLVNNGEQLLDVIIESLRRYETGLHGETPAAFRLWNDDPCKPKDENRLSDDIKIHLSQDLCEMGIIANREVEIRPGFGNGSGERTDIHVDAVIPGQSFTIKAIIEVKGCWHPQLFQDMEQQLVRRYLDDNECHYGLYLVGWFMCPQWVASDYRKSRVPRLGIPEVQEILNRQASSLSKDGMVINALVLDASIC